MTPEHFTLHEVAAGVWEAEADFSRASVGNAAIIDAGAGKTIVVDTFMTTVAARELRQVAESLTGNPLHLAVNSHWHGDHTSGNQVFADVPIASTRLTMDHIAANSRTDTTAWQSELEAAMEAARASEDAAAGARLALLQHMHDTAGEFRLTLPDLLLDGRLVVEGERTVEIVTHGRGHTVSDTIVWLPGERVVVTGDLCWNGIHPRTQDGFPEDWATYVETLLDLQPKHVIPGHGRPSDASTLEPLPGYFRELAAAVDAVREGTDPLDIAPPPGSEDWQGIERFRTGLDLLARD